MGALKFAFKLNVHGQRPQTRFQQYVELAQQAEALGYDGVYVIDHLLLPPERLGGYTNAPADKPYFLDAWAVLSALAMVTRRVKLGPQVTPIGLRHPVFVAKWGMTIDHISGGRFVLQVGAGHQEIEYLSMGFPYPPLKARAERLVEGVQIIDALWTQETPVTFQGQHYRLENVAFWPKPLQKPRPPIWFGGASGRIRQTVARLGDGWTPAAPQGAGLDPATYRTALEQIRHEAAALGRSAPIVGGALFYVAISNNLEEVERAISVLRRRADWSALSLEELGQRGIVLAGRPGDVLRAVERYAAAGVEYFTLSFVPLDDLDLTRRGMELFARGVMERF